MRITYKLLQEAAKLIALRTGKDYRVVPFPGDSGYNLVIDSESEGKGYNTVKAGLSASQISAYLDGLLDGLGMRK